jgi:hypothetical protein
MSKPPSNQLAAAHPVASPRAVKAAKDLNFKVSAEFFWRFSDFAYSRRMKKADLLRTAFALAERHPRLLAKIIAEHQTS